MPTEQELRIKRLEKAGRLVESLGEPGTWSKADRMEGFYLWANIFKHLGPEGDPWKGLADLFCHPPETHMAFVIAGILIESVREAMERVVAQGRLRLMSDESQGKWDKAYRDVARISDLIISTNQEFFEKLVGGNEIIGVSLSSKGMEELLRLILGELVEEGIKEGSKQDG